jgi:hypothetical protein
MLTTLSSITSNQAKPTKKTMSNIKLFLDYAASNQDAIITYPASDMVLVVRSDVSYLNKPKTHSCVGGHFLMSFNIADPAEMALSSTLPRSSKMLCLWPQKKSLVHCTSMLAKQYPCTYSLQEWDISNYQHSNIQPW